MSSLAPFFIALIWVLLIVAFVHSRYGDWKRHNPLVSLITFVAWYFSFIIITILPLDVASLSQYTLIVMLSYHPSDDGYHDLDLSAIRCYDGLF